MPDLAISKYMLKEAGKPVLNCCEVIKTIFRIVFLVFELL
uniref:Uncharacterized protein n=1 Tax=Lepeophtheirus salmonis TaxID=72036 RepID=A0A0K2U5R6_LEPSM